MGCKSSKSAVQSIKVTEDGVVTLSSAPEKLGKNAVVIESAESFVNQAKLVEPVKDANDNTKATSAKSRDSGIEEMDQAVSGQEETLIDVSSDIPQVVVEKPVEQQDLFEKPDAIDREIAEFTAPNAVAEAGKVEEVPDDFISSDSSSMSSDSVEKPINPVGERLQSEAILKELETAGLIQASKFNKGGAAFEVNLESPRRPALPPLAPLNRLPPRLERLKTHKKLPNKDELDRKLRLAEKRRTEKMERTKSRIALKLAKDRENALKMESMSTPATPHSLLQSPLDTPEIGDGGRTSSSFKKNVFEGSDISSIDAASISPSTLGDF